ncbi:MAG: GGDEF domain-containing protein, partial [Elusimicrobiales bacterium]
MGYEKFFYMLLSLLLITFAFFMRSLVILIASFCINLASYFVDKNSYLNMFIYTVLSIALLLQEYRIKKLSKRKFTLKDQLTGVYSRLFFEEYIGEKINKAHIFRKKFVILFIDLNDFKTINDVYGHSFGDYVLKTIASKIKENLRECDIVSRWGGDEFVVFLPDTSC